MAEITPEQIYRRVLDFPVYVPMTPAAFEQQKPQMSFDSLPAIAAFVECGATALGAAGESFRRDFETAVAAGGSDVPAVLQRLFVALGDRIDDAFVSRYFRQLYRTAFDPAISAFAKWVNDPEAKAGKRGTVVFIARSCYHIVQREAMFLRQCGFRTFLINILPIPPGNRELFERSFDGILDRVGCYLVLDDLLERIDPDVLHLQCWMWEYLMARFVSERKREAKMVCEFYDVTGIYAPREGLVTNWWEPVVDLDLACERLIFERADGIVHRFEPALIAEYGSRYGRVPPNVEIQQYVVPEFARYAEPKSAAGGPTRCVYLGNLVPRNAAHPKELFPLWGMPEAWETLLSQGISITVFNSPFRSMAEGGMDFFRQMQARHPNFIIEPGVASDKLAEAIADFDFGLVLAEMDPAHSLNSPLQFRGAVGTKLFHYFEAGLPVIVNREFESQVRIIETHGVGLALHSSEIGEAAERIAAADRAALRANVRTFNEAHGMDKEIGRLIGLYESIGAIRA